MVRSFGMSDKVGPVAYDKGRALYLETPWGQGQRDYSEETSRLIDEEIRALLVQSSDRARVILSERVDKLKEIAQVLLQKEVIEGEELKRLLR
jgi:cell division protease FtsH